MTQKEKLIIKSKKQYLKDTDWVVIKIAEEEDEKKAEALRTKYAHIIAKRKIARAKINELEGE